MEVIIETVQLIPLNALMEERRMSDRKLGELSGIHYTQISRIRNGHSRTTVATAKKLLNALGVSDEVIINKNNISPEQSAKMLQAKRAKK